MDNGRERDTGDTEPLKPDGKISRRAMIAGTVATTAVAVLPFSNYAFAETSEQDMMAFLLLSAALTGVDIQTLAPEFSLGSGDILNADPGIDPINIKNTYFDWIKTHAAPPSFAKLLNIVKSNPQISQDAIISKVNSDDDGKFLARSIVLLWYLGSWYKPSDLQANALPGTRHAISSQVVCAKAYSQGLVWLIAGAHPMGYSNLQFGYWSRDPHDLSGPNGSPLPLFNASRS
jgi:hypothetical protein